LQAELVFREIPGKLIERRGQTQWFRGLRLRRALVNPPRDRIAGIPLAPVGLRLLTARRLAVRLPARLLPASYAWVRPEPPATDGAWSLLGLGHRDEPMVLITKLPTGRAEGQFRMPGSFLESRGG
jgi:hypothetical protein